MQPGTVGHYEIIDKIGEGGMGVVWKARDLVLRRFTAIKMLPLARAGDQDRRERFLHEARTASSLNHPNIVTIHEVVTHGSREYLVMEYIDGETLDALIRRQRLKIGVALDYAVQIADALSAAHRAGVVHRDLKPGNIMVTGGGRVKVLDFGVAKLVDSGDSDELPTRESPRTAEGVLLGTVAYMSPEQAEGHAIDARSDIFSFGAVLYEMLTGQRAFRGDTRTATLLSVCEREPAPAAIPREVERVMLRCLRKDPARRWQSTADLKLALEELRDEASQRRMAVESQASVSPLRRGLRYAPWAAATAGLVATALWVGGVRFRPADPEPVVVPLTTYQGSEVDPSLSPDGRQVTFAWNGGTDDYASVYVKLVGPGEPLRLTTVPRGHAQPKWSPDGKWIAFLRVQDGPYRLGVYLIPALGGAERKLGDTSGQSLAWSPDGRSLMLSRAAAPGQAAALARMSIETGEVVTLSAPVIPQSDEGAVVSPDGQTIAFRRNFGPIGSARLFTMSASLSAPSPDALKPVAAAEHPALGLLSWSADGKDLIYSAGWNPENAGLWRMPASGTGAPVRLGFAGDGVSTPDVARAGDRMVFTRYLREINIWSLALDGSGRTAGTPIRVFDSSMSELCPSFSPDGRRVAFESNRSGNDEVWICQSDGANCTQLTSFGTHAGSPSWSPDGEWIAFDAIGSTGGSVYIVNANGGKPALLEQGQLPRWSRDGRSIYYFKGSPAQIFRVPRSGGASELMTPAGGNTVEESSDGWVYFSRSASFGPSPLRRIPIAGGEPVDVLPQIAGRNFVVVDKGLWYMAAAAKEGGVVLYDLCFYDFATKTTRALYRTNRPIYAGMTLSPDGRRMLFTQVDRTGSDLMLVEHFR
jgi:Tol biopolymer transport system component/predicted Ser/Thr protein kinase